VSPAPPSTALLEARHLTRIFGYGKNAVHAVDGVSFSLQRGEIVAVVGESGSGKSTLARIILRLLDPSSGQLLLDADDVTARRGTRKLKPYWQRVQGVFQDPFASFNQFYTVQRMLQNAFGLLDRSVSRQQRLERMTTALQSVGLDPIDVLHKHPHQLSGGQVQRATIARALIVEPDVLVADESTSMLDASLRVTILNLLADLRKQHGLAVLFITHDIGQAYYLGDRILVMYRGELVEQGPVDQVLQSPQHPYTQRLLADVPRLRGRDGLAQPTG
jgi:peptide/nickel transport system ATP-binding protein